MLRVYSRALVKVVMGKPWHLVKPVSVVAGRNLSQQKGLPRLPVPPLQQSCELYLHFLEPILELDELQRATELVEEFQKAGGVGERLQRDLERVASNTDNWLTEHWMKIMYLDCRLPVVNNSNNGILFPRMDFRDTQEYLRCAARLIAAALEFNTMIWSEILPVKYMKGKPLCMKQYKQVMSSCRIPGLKTDSLLFSTGKHITVVHNFQFFVLEVYNSDGTLLTIDQLCVQLERIYNSSLQTDMEPFGILTTENRDNWSKSYMNLIKDETNKASVSAIQSSIFNLCLDGAMPPLSEEMYPSNALHQILHGGGSQWNSGNRWFDKGMQLIIREDGISGSNFSHVVADGIVAMEVSDYVAAYLKKPQVMQSSMEPLPVPRKLHFNITPEIKKDIEEAKQNMDILTQDLDLKTSVFDHFGRNFLKAQKMSSDVFLQLAIQLAYYRTYQRLCPTMEPATLRMFRLGRLCSINSNSPASAAFVKAFDDNKIQNSEKVNLLKKAMEAQRWHTNMAINGQSIETHWHGLIMMAIQENISMPDIFTDTSYTKAFDYGISTSQVTSKNGCLPCCGPDEPGLIDILYSVMDNHVDLEVSSFKSSNTCKESNSDAMIRGMEDALYDMRTMLVQSSGAKL
ncbi:carnitine O-acetyltransferase-like [Cottoperca gobio]|uniref:Carnitine O-acetyltransferase-like n=1 Tax=Cottoperca gobio TaxID=56716 RepID=A0A6J2PEC5_COTGO|nr:carnitine O-acetyltransferase-like [Cottoperca gobio]